jgi:hypothetical protein
VNPKARLAIARAGFVPLMSNFEFSFAHPCWSSSIDVSASMPVTFNVTAEIAAPVRPTSVQKTIRFALPPKMYKSQSAQAERRELRTTVPTLIRRQPLLLGGQGAHVFVSLLESRIPSHMKREKSDEHQAFAAAALDTAEFFIIAANSLCDKSLKDARKAKLEKALAQRLKMVSVAICHGKMARPLY